MNRIQGLAVLRQSNSATATEVAEQRNATHAVFAPLHYERNYAYPLIIWLHGPHDNEHQLKQVMPLVSMRNYVAVAPRGTLHLADATGPGRYDWCQEEEHILLAEQRVADAVRAARERFHIHSDRVFIAGLFSGGTMAIRLALHHPHWFAGALSLHGAFPRGHAPLRRYQEVRRLQLFLATGRAGKTYPESKVCDDLRLTHAAGISVNLRQYPCGDDVTTLMLADMNRWMMSHVTSTDAADCDQVDRESRRHS